MDVQIEFGSNHIASYEFVFFFCVLMLVPKPSRVSG